MVFLTVGFTDNDFTRLLAEADRLVELGVIGELFGQIGTTEYTPKHYSYRKFMPFEELERYMSSSDYVISHGGTGSVNMALGMKKKTIVVPRLMEFAEHPDNHQLELAELLHQQKRVLRVIDIRDLCEAVRLIETWEPVFKQTGTTDSLIAFLKEKTDEFLCNTQKSRVSRRRV